MPVRNTIHIGDAKLTLVEELVMPTSARWMLPDHPEPFALLERARPWLEPHMLNERGHILQSIHSWLIEVDGMRIVVDTGIGNDKDRESGGFEGWHMRSGPYLEDLAAAGMAADSVDVVLNTHLHGDHAGWNTRWVDGAWVPTFANARYRLVEPEWRYWSTQADPTPDIIEDSVRPVVEAGVVDLVPADHRVGDSVWLEASHGHTPGHVCVRIHSAGQDAVIIGDVMHSPIQCAAPEQRPPLDRFVEEARAARIALLERYADTRVVVLGTHFHTPASGYFRRDGNAYRYDVFEGDPPAA